MSARTRKDWILWGALGCALVSTAHAEYTLATAAHFNEYVALAVPGALDLYVIRALQQRRDVLVAVLAMVAANVASHLIAGGVLAVTWHVIAAVGAVAPLIVWRVYSLKYTRTRQELLWGLDAGTLPEGTSTAGTPVPEVAPGYHLDGCDGVHLDSVRCEAHLSGAVSAPGYVPDHVPATWVHPGTPETYPPLVPVPDLPDEYAPDAVHSVTEPLLPGDLELLPAVQDYLDTSPRPSLRGLKRALNIGQTRAERLLAHLGVKA